MPSLLDARAKYNSRVFESRFKFFSANAFVLLFLQCNSSFAQIAFHIEPWPNRGVNELREAISYIMKTYSRHPAFYFHKFQVLSIRAVFTTINFR